MKNCREFRLDSLNLFFGIVDLAQDFAHEDLEFLEATLPQGVDRFVGPYSMRTLRFVHLVVDGP